MDKLTILWTTDNEITIRNMVFMYAKNAKIQRWFDEVKIIIWGASSYKLTETEWIQSEIKDLIYAGIEVVACLACSDNLGITPKLKDLGIDIRYVGQELSEVLKTNEKILTL